MRTSITEPGNPGILPRGRYKAVPLLVNCISSEAFVAVDEDKHVCLHRNGDVSIGSELFPCGSHIEVEVLGGWIYSPLDCWQLAVQMGFETHYFLYFYSRFDRCYAWIRLIRS